MTAQPASIATANAEFWNELCGSYDAKRLGITDDSAASLRRFDDWYFSFYSYLDRHLPRQAFAGKRVLEVGLGYGSVAQRLAEAGAIYHGIDIASGPVSMVQHRLRLVGRAGDVRRADILNCPFPDGSFDCVVSIGCLHHTGDLRRALAETRRVLVPGGRAVIMIYNAYSYRRWLRWPLQTARYFLWDRFGLGRRPHSGVAERAAYDANMTGAEAPETVFLSGRELRSMVSDWSQADLARENIGGELFLRLIDRDLLLRMLGRVTGLDLYAHLVK